MEVSSNLVEIYILCFLGGHAGGTRQSGKRYVGTRYVAKLHWAAIYCVGKLKW